jgi:hypothetical protein
MLGLDDCLPGQAGAVFLNCPDVHRDRQLDPLQPARQPVVQNARLRSEIDTCTAPRLRELLIDLVGTNNCQLVVNRWHQARSHPKL